MKSFIKKLALCLGGVTLVVTLAIPTPSSHAFPTYSQNRDATNCAFCHGDFRADNYISNTDGQDWGNLHNLHRFTMLAEDSPVSKCDVCHMGGGELRFPVYLSESATDYLAPIGCVGCHGRVEDVGHDSISLGFGAGLRQHHTNAGVGLCADCHTDADPANYTPVGEHFAPPNYFTPDDVFTNKPTDSCSSFGEENYAGIWQGLDNDGDGHHEDHDHDHALQASEDRQREPGGYDVLDSDCTPPFGMITICHVLPTKRAAVLQRVPWQNTGVTNLGVRDDAGGHVMGKAEIGAVGQNGNNGGHHVVGRTITVNLAALGAHLAHGDVPGPCED